MNNETIKIDGQDYEVLTTDPESIKHITHARLAGGDIWMAKGVKPTTMEAYAALRRPSAGSWCQVVNASDFTAWGIQPLKLIERKPVEFVATFAKIGHEWHPVYNLDEGLAQQGREQKEFRCVEVTK
jgi:hypothetical protein